MSDSATFLFNKISDTVSGSGDTLSAFMGKYSEFGDIPDNSIYYLDKDPTYKGKMYCDTDQTAPYRGLDSGSTGYALAEFDDTSINECNS